MEESRIKISVVIPTYNNLEMFKRCLSSVLVQEFKDYEIIITDDSNNDGIKDFIETLSFSKIKYFKNEKALGSPENWNEGLRKAEGEYIKILHHDDWLADEKALGKFVKLMEENPKSDFGYAKSENVDTKTGKVKKRNPKKYFEKIKTNPFELFFSNRIGAPSVVIFKNNKDIFFDKNLKWVVDIDFYLQSILKNPDIVFLDECLINIGISSTQVTESCINNKEIEIFEQFYLYDKFKSHLKKLPDEERYQDELLDLIKRFEIKTLEELKEILKTEIEIPNKIVNYLNK